MGMRARRLVVSLRHVAFEEALERPPGMRDIPLDVDGQLPGAQSLRVTERRECDPQIAHLHTSPPWSLSSGCWIANFGAFLRGLGWCLSRLLQILDEHLPKELGAAFLGELLRADRAGEQAHRGQEHALVVGAHAEQLVHAPAS